MHIECIYKSTWQIYGVRLSENKTIIMMGIIDETGISADYTAAYEYVRRICLYPFASLYHKKTPSPPYITYDKEGGSLSHYIF